MKKKNNAYDLGGILQGIAPLLGLIPGGQVAAPIASMAGGFISQANQQNQTQPLPVQQNSNPYGFAMGGMLADPPKKKKYTYESIPPTNKLKNQRLKVNWTEPQNSHENRNLVNTAVQFIPYYEQYLDFKDVAQGATQKNKEQLNRGALGLLAPFAGKAVMNTADYLSDKIIGVDKTNYNAEKRTDLINKGENFTQKLFNKYGYGGYDK